MKLANRLKDLRIEKGLSQAALADIVGRTQQAVGKWEVGKSEPDSATLSKLATYFNVTTDYLIGKTDNPHGTPFAGQSPGNFLTFAGQAEADQKVGHTQGLAAVSAAALSGDIPTNKGGALAAAGLGMTGVALGGLGAVAGAGAAIPLAVAGAISSAIFRYLFSHKPHLDTIIEKVDDAEVIDNIAEDVVTRLAEPEESKMVSQYRTLSDEDKKVVQRLIDSLAPEKEEPKEDGDIPKNGGTEQ
jgi:transcriptional regulator with XRE-family HTH domain